jgi:hypothetical protein
LPGACNILVSPVTGLIGLNTVSLAMFRPQQTIGQKPADAAT